MTFQTFSNVSLGRTAAAVAFAGALGAVSAPAHAVVFTSFNFDSAVSTSGQFGGVNGIYGNGDVRLDGVSFGGHNLTQQHLQTVSGTTIVLDDGRDVARGGGNLAAGRGVNSVADTWTTEGAATVTPTSADLRSALANYNLTGLVVTRENNGIAIVDVTFAKPADTFFVWERGFNSDLLVESLDDTGGVTGSYTILRANYQRTGIIVSTDNNSFVIAGQELGSIGFQTDTVVSRLRLISVQSDVTRFNGPDYKILATAGPIAAVPEPSTWAMMGLGVGLMGFNLSRRRIARR